MTWACPVARLDEQSGERPGAVSNGRSGVKGVYDLGTGPVAQQPGFDDSGGASRFFNTFAPPDDVEPFFWCAKPSAAETEAGCERLPLKSAAENVDREPGTKGASNPRAGAGREHSPMLKLRADLTPEQRAFVLAELSRRGVAL